MSITAHKNSIWITSKRDEKGRSDRGIAFGWNGFMAWGDKGRRYWCAIPLRLSFCWTRIYTDGKVALRVYSVIPVFRTQSTFPLVRS